jgi:hypothetical protein
MTQAGLDSQGGKYFPFLPEIQRLEAALRKGLLRSGATLLLQQSRDREECIAALDVADVNTDPKWSGLVA